MNYLTLAKYGIIAAAFVGIGIYLGHLFDKAAYAALQGQYSAFQVQVAHEREAAQKAATDALEAQIAARNITEANNAKVVQELQNRADTSAADLARANRLLELAAQDNARPRPVSQAADQPGTAPASQASGPSGLTQLLVATRQECSDNADKLDALIAEIRPQL